MVKLNGYIRRVCDIGKYKNLKQYFTSYDKTIHFRNPHNSIGSMQRQNTISRFFLDDYLIRTILSCIFAKYYEEQDNGFNSNA
jgi:hypothetical protein